MKIKTLKMNAFGKFREKKIDLSPGLNLIQGDNEAGKTTIQTFMQGMFFGFFKPYRKKKTYSLEYEKYLPWKQFDYRGVLVYEIDGQEFRLERNFLRGKEELTIYDNLTGKNITDAFKFDGVIRQHLPLADLGMNQVLYNNTVNIRQNRLESERDSQKEMQEYYQEAQNNGTSETNLNAVVKRLENKKKAIGRSGQSKSPIGLAIREREKLKGVLKESEDVFQKISENQKTISTLQNRVKYIEVENENSILVDAINRKKEFLENQKRISSLENENTALLKTIKEWNKLEIFNTETLEGLRTIQKQIDNISSQIAYAEIEINDIEFQLRESRQKEEVKRKTFGDKTWEKIQEDYEIYEQQKKKLELPQEKTKIIGFWITSIFLLLIGVFMVGNMVVNSSVMKQRTADIFLIVGLLFVFVGLIGNIMAMIIILRGKQTNKKIMINEKQHAILMEYEMQEPEDYEEFFKKTRKIKVELEQMKNEGELLSVQQSRRSAGYEVLFDQRRSALEERKRRLISYGVSSIEAYEKGVKKGEELRALKKQFKANQQIIEGLYRNANLELGLEENRRYNKSPQTDELLKLGKEIARLEGESNTLMKGIALPVELRENIKTLDIQIQECTQDLKACDAAINAIEEIQKTTHQKNVPELNERIGEILEDITQHYKGVNVDESMKLKVVDPKGGDFRDIEQLSTGTIDQVQFAFRYGFSDLLDNPMPFILDEPFIRYDIGRKNQALKLLAELSQHRQIILFTCNQDEGNILEELGVFYQKIQL